MREPRKWTKATRVKGGGVHLYIPAEIINRTLELGGIPKDAASLEVCFYGTAAGRGRGNVQVRLKEVVPDASN